jgi:sugar lactone lactonase YvrE
VFPHGIHVDRDGNIWVTDANDNRPTPARGQPASTTPGTVGHQVIKFSPDGKVLLRLGKAGVAGNPPEALTEPNDLVTAPNGDIFVALKVMYLIPDPDNPDASKTTSGTSAAEGVAVDAAGNVYGAEVGPKAIKKYSKK